MESLRDRFGFEIWRVVEVGDGSGYFQDAVVKAGAEALLGHGRSRKGGRTFGLCGCGPRNRADQLESDQENYKTRNLRDSTDAAADVGLMPLDIHGPCAWPRPRWFCPSTARDAPRQRLLDLGLSAQNP
jgi:hypothetical protein